ncbi:S1 RNA-binding domain-containing protein [Myxococcota bacterium]|nr:S1 RNA-binding domain-containing protein [Myxococcota bacterium]MBU1380698.1 S1 RNA-binding domain-containing protein [Myxococcota bacterium]MBU1495906.1 S1 RNA-binding domain-containing protein [Myxococcota bacterium]
MRIPFSNFHDISGWPFSEDDVFFTSPVKTFTPDWFKKKGIPGLNWLSWCSLLMDISDYRLAVSITKELDLPDEVIESIKSSKEAAFISDIQAVNPTENLRELVLKFRGCVNETIKNGHLLHTPLDGFPEKCLISQSLPTRYLGFIKKSGPDNIKFLIPQDTIDGWNCSTTIPFPERWVLSDVRSRVDRIASTSRLENAFSNWESFLRVHIKSGTAVSIYHVDDKASAVCAITDDSGTLLDSYRIDKHQDCDKILEIYNKFSSNKNPLIFPLSSSTVLLSTVAKKLTGKIVYIPDAAIKFCGESIGLERKLTTTHPHVLRAVALSERARDPLSSAKRVQLADLGLFEYASGPQIDNIDFMLEILRILPIPDQDSKRQITSTLFNLNPLIKNIDDLKPGMTASGTVTSIASFGAFIRITQDLEGLLHISEMSDDRVTDIHSIVKVGDTITLRILNIDKESGRIGLTLKSLNTNRNQRVKQKNLDALEKLFKK